MEHNSYKLIDSVDEIVGLKFKEKKDKQYTIMELLKKHTFVFFPALNVLINKTTNKTIVLLDS